MAAWFGSKAAMGLCHAIVSLMPPHRVYIETHLGGGAIMKRKPPALRNIGIDLNARSIRTFGCDYEVELVHGCCHRFLADFAFAGDELVYSDPPYLHSVRKSQRRYRYDYEETDHVALLALLKGLPCSVMISGYPSALYDRVLRGLAQCLAAGDEPGRGGDREDLVQLRAGPAALAQLCGPELHRPPAHQAPCRELGPALPVDASGASGLRCCRRSWRWRRSDADGERGLAA